MNRPKNFTRKAQKLQAIAADLQPFLELVRALDGKDFTIPTDRLIRTHEAAQILAVESDETVAKENVARQGVTT